MGYRLTFSRKTSALVSFFYYQIDIMRIRRVDVKVKFFRKEAWANYVSMN